MKRIRLSREDFEEFRDVQIRPRAGWPAIFSCNDCREVWPYFTRGLAPVDQREYLQGKLPPLDKIVEIILEKRRGGGRFFINDQGVFMRPEGSPEQKVAEFEIS